MAQTIGKELNYGFAGNFARNPDAIITTRPNGSTENILFGSALIYDTSGNVIPADATTTMDNFAGIAAFQMKSALDYQNQGKGGEYAPMEAVSVFQRGSISVICKDGTPAQNGEVFIYTTASGTMNVGDFTADSAALGTVQIENAQWGTAADPNGITELVLLTRANA